MKASTSIMNFLFISLYEFFVVSENDEMNCNLVFGVFYNVFKNANSGYMK